MTRAPAAAPVEPVRDASLPARPLLTVVAPAPVKPPAELAGMLLPSEAVEFGSSPHAIVFARPVVGLAVIAIVLAVVLSWNLHPVVRGHHVTTPLVSGIVRNAVWIAAALLALRELVSLAGRVSRYFGYRVIATNRRVFVIEGLFGRRVTPIGNSVLAGSTLSQGPLGRMLGFGDLVFRTGSGFGTMRTMRDPIRLYREVEAVANGVDGDHWTPAIRQTQIP
ncbi:MAG: PH domain-containing protein [Candidatus Elarobacter sp.]